MIIQKILFPNEKYSDIPELYFKGNGEFLKNSKSIILNQDNKISFNTYFNSFSIGKWRRYTTLSDLSLVLKYKGDIKVKAFSAVSTVIDPGYYDIYDGKLRGKKTDLKKERIGVETESYTENGINIIRIKFISIPDEGIIFVSLKAKKDSVIYGGYYETEGQSSGKKKLALLFCTYKRENELLKNLDNISREIIKNQDSPLYGRVRIYISDNGGTIHGDERFKKYINSPDIKIFKNKNAGGAGGFTRGMIEALSDPDFKWTNLILMDDDILLMPETVVRTEAFLRLLKDEYKNYMIGAEMLSLEDRSLLYESGGERHGVKISFYRRGWDLTKTKNIAIDLGEAEDKINYSGWWYNVINRDVLKDGNNLPMPFFIYFDDIEYGKRNKENDIKGGTIMLNGISVWHPQGVGKASPGQTYYHIRNILISMCDDKDRSSRFSVMKYIFMYVFINIIRYRYEEAEASLLALNDYFLGPEQFMKTDPEKKNKKVFSFKRDEIKLSNDEITTLFDLKNEKKDKDPHSVFHIMLSSFFLFLPKWDDEKICLKSDFSLPFLHNKVALLDPKKGTKEILKRDKKKESGLFYELFCMEIKILLQYEKTEDRYKEKKSEMIRESFWKEYLEIKDI